MKLLLIRHGESQADILNLHEGRADFSLTDCGKLQAQAMSEYIKQHFEITKIYSSPLLRAKQTAEYLSRTTNINITFDDNLKEYNNGLLAGFTHEEARKRYPEVKRDCDESLYGMESVNAFAERIRKVYSKIVSECKKDDIIAIITHGGVINQLYQQILAIKKESNIVLGSSDTGIHLWYLDNKSTKIIKSNMTEHITKEISEKTNSVQKLSTAYFAGGCFWCITPIFKMYKAQKSLCGYSGGDEVNPTYEMVKAQKTGHRETIAVQYDSNTVSFEKLLDIYLANVDPFDKDGQFIDRGHSYTLAVYYTNEAEKLITLNKIKELEEKSGKKVYIAVEKLINFYEAEEYHQDYYLKNPEAFEKELIESGRKK